MEMSVNDKKLKLVFFSTFLLKKYLYINKQLLSVKRFQQIKNERSLQWEVLKLVPSQVQMGMGY